MGLAAQGARVAVVTIDPARGWRTRSASTSSATSPALVDPARFAGHGVELRGELWAMMLDAKRTFDELIERLAPDEETRDEVLGNRIYQQLSGAVAGLAGVHRGGQALRARTPPGASTSSSSTRRRRATRSTSSTRPTG